MKTKITLHFYAKSTKANAAGQFPIYIRITIDGKRLEFSIKKFVDAAKWSPELSRMKGNSEDARSLNEYLDLMKSKIFDVQMKLIHANEKITSEVFKNELFGITENKRMLIPIFKNHNNKIKELVGKEYAPGTLERYNTSLKHTKAFLEWKYKISDIDIKKIDHAFITEYEFYLRSVRNCCNNTAVKYIKNFSKIIKICLANDWLDKNPFSNYKSTVSEVERVYLSEIEIQNIINKEFKTERLSLVRDIFVFSCFTGLAYIDVKRSQLNEIIKGKRNINADLALLLEKALGIDADFWMEAQKNYDLDKARIEAKNKEQLEAIEIWNVAKAFMPVAFYKKEQVLSGNPVTDNQKIREIYRVANLDQLATISVRSRYHRFKKSTKLKTDVVNIIGWVKLVQFKASELIVPTFNHENQEQLIADLRAILLRNKDTLNKVQNKLHDYGIKLVYQAKGEKTPVDGVSFWSNGNPAIGMTLRHNRLDNFAFTLFHELGHIYKHLVNNDTAEFIDLETKNEGEEYKNSAEEKQADHFALTNLISDEDWNQFKKNLPYNNNAAIMAFAKQVKIHPSIVRGRVCFALDNFRSYTSIINEIN